MTVSKAKLGKNVSIGEYTIIKNDVTIGNDVQIGGCVLIDNGARITDGVKIHHSAIIASPPQDLKYNNEPTECFIGKNSIIREFATVARGTTATRKVIVGENCLIMNYVHIAHDCVLGDNVILANYCGLAGHVELGDWVIMGGASGVHQFCKIGKHAMIGAGCIILKDVPPFLLVGGLNPKFHGLNKIGLIRRGFSKERLEKINEAYHALYRSGLNISDGLKKIKNEIELTEDVSEIVSFVENSSRGIVGI